MVRRILTRELVSAAVGLTLEPGTTLAVDGHRTSVDTPLRDLVLLEGSRIGRTPDERPLSTDGWTVTLAGGLEAGLVVPVPRGRKLVVGRAPQADVVLPTESASWEHCTVDREDDGVRVRDAGSTNGTVIAGERIDAEGSCSPGRRASSWAGPCCSSGRRSTRCPCRRPARWRT
ncbi:FHA domain-containing protein [Curtobacterium sp. 24E2]